MEIIGLSGYARSGKDAAAKVLVEEFGFTRVAFADKLRDFLYALNPIVDIHKADVGVSVRQSDGSTKRLMIDKDTQSTIRVSMPLYVQDIIDKYGWDGYKETMYGKEIRRLLQRLGTEAGRETLWDTIWIDAAFTGLPEDAKIVVSDARFFNEFDAIRSRGGVIWRIEREGVGPANNHASELEAVDYPFFRHTIENNGSLEAYREKIRELVR